MTLPSNHPITAEQINVELGRAPGAVFNMNGAEERALAGVPTGPYSFSDFLGKSVTPPPPTLDFSQTDSSLTFAASHAGMAFGADVTNRRIVVVAFHANTAGNPGNTPTCTIGGVAATRIVASTTGDGASRANGVAIFTANPSGTSGTVSVTWSGQNTIILVFRAVGYNVSAAHATDESAGSGDTGSLSLNIPAGGMLLSAVADSDAVAGFTWTGVTERGDTTAADGASNHRLSWGWNFDMSSETGRAVTISPYTATNGRTAVSAASFAKL